MALNWTSKNSGTNTDLSAVTHGNGIFVAVGEHGAILTSSDGVNWTSRNSGTGADLSAVTYGNGTFITFGNAVTIPAPGGKSYEVLLASADGITWTKTNCDELETNCENMPSVDSVTFGNGTFVAVSSSGFIMTSADGMAWTSRSVNQVFTAVVYGNGTFIAVANTGTISTSADGITWRTSKPSGTSGALFGVTYGDRTFVTVGFTSPPSPDSVCTPGVILTSPDGITWTFRNSAGICLLSGVAYGSGTFVAVGGNKIYQSDPL